MTGLPNVSDLVQTGISKGTFKAALSNLRAHLFELLGGTGSKADALKALGAPLNSKADKVGAYTVVATDRGQVINCSGTWPLSISDAASLGDGFVFAVLNSGSGTITLDPYLSQQIDGATTKALGAGKLLLVYCDGEKLTSVGGLDAAAIAAALGYTPANQANAATDHNHSGTYVPANMTHGAVGSLVFAVIETSGTTHNPGSTMAGSDLRSGCAHVGGIEQNTTVLTGTWRCLGYISSSIVGATLWQRIS